MRFLDHPLRLRAHVSAVPLPEEEAVLIVSEDESRFLEDEVYRDLLPLVDGERTGLELIEALRTKYRTAELLRALSNLHGSLGVLSSLRDPRPPSEAAFWSAAGVELAAETKGRAELLTLASEPATQAARAALDVAELLARSAEEASLAVVVVDDYLHPELPELAKRLSKPWLLAKLSGAHAWFGPFFEDAESACLACLRYRLVRNRNVWALLDQLGANPGVRASTPSSLRTAASFLATMAEGCFATTRPRSLANTLIKLKLEAATSVRHVVVKRPQCAACGVPSLPEMAPLVLQSRPVGDRSTYRPMTAQALLDKYAHHISPLTGLVPALSPVTDDDATHVYGSGHHPGRPVFRWKAIRERRRNNSAGKGTTETQARASALAEALERYCARSDGTEPVHVASFEELGDSAIHPNALMNYSQHQLTSDLAGSRVAPNLKDRVPEPFDERAPTDWLSAWSLSERRFRYVPAGVVLFDHPRGPRFQLVACGNGCAAGATLEDAILQGLYELIERDAAAVWWYNRIRRAVVDVEGIDDAYVRPLRAFLASQGREFWVLDITSDIRVPVYVSICRRGDGGPEQTVVAFGAHADPRVAALRAVTEMAQTMPWALANAERADRRVPAADHSNSVYSARVADHPYLLPDPGQTPIRVADLDAPTTTDIRDLVQDAQRQIEARGHEVLVSDLSRPDVGLPVVKVMAPGLRHYWRRLGPGRLYDVPVRMGWLESPLSEAELNPIEVSG